MSTRWWYLKCWSDKPFVLEQLLKQFEGLRDQVLAQDIVQPAAHWQSVTKQITQ